MDWFFEISDAIAGWLEANFGGVMSAATDWEFLGKIATVGGVATFFLMMWGIVDRLFFAPGRKRRQAEDARWRGAIVAIFSWSRVMLSVRKRRGTANGKEASRG